MDLPLQHVARFSPCGWIRDIDLRRQVSLGLSKGEARDPCARAGSFTVPANGAAAPLKAKPIAHRG
jgi:hypothetical protein